MDEHSVFCDDGCLGRLTFHPRVKGEKITLSHGKCRASRDLETFKNGLVFSSRPVKRKEKVQIQVERSLLAWNGAVRVGFTNVRPTKIPLPPLAMPDLTDKRGYSALPVPHEHCPPGTEISFWMNRTGQLCFETSTGVRDCRQTDLDLSQDLWALIDVYGQSTTVVLLGSTRNNGWFTVKSCPIPESPFGCWYENTPPKLQKRLEMIKRSQEDRSNNDSPQTKGGESASATIHGSAPSLTITGPRHSPSHVPGSRQKVSSSVHNSCEAVERHHKNPCTLPIAA